MESGKHKKKINYTIMIISDSPEGGKPPLYLKRGLVTAAFWIFFILLAGLTGVVVHHSLILQDAGAQEAELQKQIDQLTQENQALAADNSELSDKVMILSGTVTRSEETKAAQEAEEEAKRIPNGFPIAGPAVILESSETANAAVEADTEDGEETVTEREPIVVFSASPGTKVVAAANGTVSSIEDDAVYGHRINIDHGNGYVSIYRTVSEPDVSEGDEVESGAVLYEMQSQEERMGYQITQDGTLIDPLDLLEVYG